jgi:2',3'-cyclic-nucleotide 2'-phosphodiesterase (5'-nucleotidase family)
MNFHKHFLPLLLSATLIAGACNHKAAVTSIDVSSVELNKTALQTDSATAHLLRPYKDSLDHLMNIIIGKTDVAMPKERDKPETLLGNFVADICLQRINAMDYKSPGAGGTLALFNTGGLRSSLPKGDITRGNIFELMPFDNELVVLTLSGKKTWELIRFVAMTGGQPMAGLKLAIHPDKTPATAFINGQLFDSTKTYRVITSDYLANGGDKMDFFKNPVSIQTTGILIRNAIMEYCIAETKQGHLLTAKLDGRFYYETK